MQRGAELVPDREAEVLAAGGAAVISAQVKKPQLKMLKQSQLDGQASFADPKKYMGSFADAIKEQ